MPFHVSPLRSLFSTGRVSGDARPVSRRQLCQRRKARGRRVKAILAGGLVFGVGATATVAAWTDSEEASGSFEAGRFNIELSTDGQWTGTNEMTFNAGAMYPGQKVYAPVSVRTTSNTSLDGKLTVSAGGISDPNVFASALTYRAVARSTSSVACNSDNFPGPGSFVFGSAAGAIPLSSTPAAGTTQTLKAASASVQDYCFEVSLPSGTSSDAQGLSASHTWTFTAESTTPGS
ncbi:SipW-cognate class signal peptide [Brevibacterium siliguriense]|uniref:SipW-cognate class signal peptide n=1 Tax=Brevibacterium siliguriense TaxID=1136497 RepID=A0A1H1XMX3_9MICO|nr:SipW-dependent-type signal peptide-containing protein [Brevibacterium siliguriense]SDT10615.1 SipW-cognate class signal peptide [Brevibacterium siliguriense]